MAASKCKEGDAEDDESDEDFQASLWKSEDGSGDCERSTDDTATSTASDGSHSEAGRCTACRVPCSVECYHSMCIC